MSFFDTEDYERQILNYENKIQTLSEWLWENKPKQGEITEWLENFNSKDCGRERLNALHQLSYFMSFELREIREMLKSLFRDLFIKPLIQKIKKKGFTTLKEIDIEISKQLHKTRFIGLGNASESSCLMLYFFRQENGLSKEHFINASDIYTRNDTGNIISLRKHGPESKKQEILHYIFMDDFSGSGSQASDYFSDIQSKMIKKLNADATVYYFTLFSTNVSYKKLNSYDSQIKLRSIFELDETYKVFGNKSRYYGNNNQERIFSEKTCKSYKERYSQPSYICGWKDGQLLLRFFYNTPDNTLPSFWSKSDTWKPIFKRYDKIYD
jgi:hypothetical protein